MTFATPKKKPAASIAAATAVARRQWLEWVNTLAEGRELEADPVTIVQSAALLDRRDPGVALEADAAIVKRVRNLEARAESSRARIAATLDKHGGLQAIRARVAELKAELREIEKLAGQHPGYLTAGQYAGEASRLRRDNPHLFPETTTATRRATR